MSIKSRIILWLNSVIDDSLYGSIPDCRDCDEAAMNCFCQHIDVIVEKGEDNEAPIVG